jgi:hypothetical protein
LIDPIVAEDAPKIADGKSNSKLRNGGDLTDPLGPVDAPRPLDGPRPIDAPPLYSNKRNGQNNSKKLRENNYDPNDHLPDEIPKP